MPNDPHRDALEAALARVGALEEENRELRSGAGRAPAPDVPLTPADRAADQMIDATLAHLAQKLDTDRAPDAEPAPEPAPRVLAPGASCAACGSDKTLRGQLERKLGTLSVGRGDFKLTRARVCARCGHVMLFLEPDDRAWLEQRFASALAAEDDE